MAKGYWIVAYRSINDAKKLEAYRTLAALVMQGSGGRPLVRGDPERTCEAGLDQRVVVGGSSPGFGNEIRGYYPSCSLKHPGIRARFGRLETDSWRVVQRGLHD